METNHPKLTPKLRVFPCNTCSLTFQTSELQRSHMRQPWHINNLHRRIAEQSALSEEQYDAEFNHQELILRPKSSPEQSQKLLSHDTEPTSYSPPDASSTSDTTIPKTIPPTQCLFCNMSSPSLAANTSHMSTTHGLFIPSPAHLRDTESLLHHLATTIFSRAECLYCGAEKGSVDAVQTHMRDKGHCMLNSAAPEIRGFWTWSDSDGSSDARREHMVNVSGAECRLASGVVHARGTSSARRAKRGDVHSVTAESREVMEVTPNVPSSCSSDRRLAGRGHMGLVGVSESHKRALVTTEQKMQRREAVAKATRRYAAEQAPVKGKYYKTENPVYQAG